MQYNTRNVLSLVLYLRVDDGFAVSVVWSGEIINTRKGRQSIKLDRQIHVCSLYSIV